MSKSRSYYKKTDKYKFYKKGKKISLKWSALPIMFYYVENLIINKTFRFNSLKEAKDYIVKNF